MRTIPPAFQTMLSGDALTTAWCVRLIRLDGVSIGFTEHDRPLTVDGTVCEPTSGANISALTTNSSMAVDNGQMTAFLDSNLITENDLIKGAYDGATLIVSIVDWTNPINEIVISTGYIGEISTGDTTFNTEFRSLAQRLQQTIGRKIGVECDADFGDERCKINMGPYVFTASITAVVSTTQFTINPLGNPGAGDPLEQTFFQYGFVEWSNGDDRNTQKDCRIKTFNKSQWLVTLVEPTIDVMQVDDTMTLTAGCDKRTSTCQGRSNYVNFQGFPHVPGRDSLLERPSAK